VGLNYVLRQNLQGSSRVKQLSCAVVNNEISLISACWGACRNMVPIMDGWHNKERAAALNPLPREMKRQIKYNTPRRLSFYTAEIQKRNIFVSFICQAAGEFVIHKMQTESG
jgi:hypothetical protein